MGAITGTFGSKKGTVVKRTTSENRLQYANRTLPESM